MPEHNPGQMGGTMRLGKRRTLFQTKNSVMSKSCPTRPLAGTCATLVLVVLRPGWRFSPGPPFEVCPFLATRQVAL